MKAGRMNRMSKMGRMKIDRMNRICSGTVAFGRQVGRIARIGGQVG